MPDRPLAFPLYLGPVAPDASAIPKDVAAAQALAQQLQTLRFKLPPSGMVLRGETTVPMRLVLPKAPWDQNDSTEACKWVMRWSFTPEKARLTMEPVSVAEYQRWLPSPTDQANLYPDGKPLDFRAKFEAATGGMAPTGRIRFTLRDFSEHPGICQNDPPFGTPDNKPDIRFATEQGQGIRRLSDTQCETEGDVKEATVRVEATDTGGFAHLAVESPNLGLQGQWKGKMDLSIPLDDNDNEIADAWDERSSDKSRNADDEPRDGQASDGDGLPLSDEYRGFVLWENGSKVFKRTNPKDKDVFVLVEDGEVGRNKEVDLDLFRTYSRLVGHEVRTPNVGIDTSLKGARRLDFNDDAGSTRLTYSLRIKFTPYGPAGLRDPNLTNAPANQLDPNARAYLAGAGAGGEATPLGADLIMVFRARIQNVADFFFNILETALISPNTPYPQNGATLGSRLTQLPPSVRANAEAAVARWKANREAVTRSLAEDTVRMSVLHEMLHACGVNHHEPTTEGEETHCLIRYFTVAQEWEICINSATLPGWKQHGHNYTQVCRGRESKCWEGITTTP